MKIYLIRLSALLFNRFKQIINKLTYFQYTCLLLAFFLQSFIAFTLNKTINTNNNNSNNTNNPTDTSVDNLIKYNPTCKANSFTRKLTYKQKSLNTYEVRCISNQRKITSSYILAKSIIILVEKISARQQ